LKLNRKDERTRRLNNTKSPFRPSAFLFNPLQPHTQLCVVTASFALALVGCARPAALPARYTGTHGTGGFDSASVREVHNKPSAYVMLGSVTARCRADAGVRSIRDAWLADVDCSEELLVAALREKAAAVGGGALVERECVRDEHSCSEAWTSTLITCSASVAGPAALSTPVDGSGHPLPFTPVVRPLPRDAVLPALGSNDGGWVAAPKAAEVEYESVTQAFRVKVSFTPVNPSAAPRAPKDPDRVRELATLPPSHVVMGDIAARCRNECDRTAVRYAVRAAAARVGATDVAGIACVQTKHGFLCTGRAARPEADPETDLLAR
jgi:hypothetical protein